MSSRPAAKRRATRSERTGTRPVGGARAGAHAAARASADQEGRHAADANSSWLRPAPVLGALALLLAGSAASWGNSMTLTSADSLDAVADSRRGTVVLTTQDGPKPPFAAPDPVSTPGTDLTGNGVVPKQVERQADKRAAALDRVVSRAQRRGEELLQELREKREAARLEREAARLEREAARLEREAAREEQEQRLVEQEAANGWVAPLSGYALTARWGEISPYWSTYHTGVDLAAPSGTPLVAVAAGTVTYVGYDGAYGNKTEIALEDGTVIWYAHQTSQTVSVGDSVSSGELIGYVGATGNVTGPHLHLEVRLGGAEGLDGQDVDPIGVFAEHGVSL